MTTCDTCPSSPAPARPINCETAYVIAQPFSGNLLITTPSAYAMRNEEGMVVPVALLTASRDASGTVAEDATQFYLDARSMNALIDNWELATRAVIERITDESDEVEVFDSVPMRRVHEWSLSATSE